MTFRQSSSRVPHVFNVHVARHFELIFSRMTVCVVGYHNRLAATPEPRYLNLSVEFQFSLNLGLLSYLSVQLDNRKWSDHTFWQTLFVRDAVVRVISCRSLSANWILPDVLAFLERKGIDILSVRVRFRFLVVARTFSWKLALLLNEFWVSICPIRTRVNEYVW